MEDTDFSWLYRELGVGPDTDVEVLTRAYRRRLRALHPDTGNGASNAADLASLVQRYRHAMEFFRLHGRLPGAAAHNIDTQETGHTPRQMQVAPSEFPDQEEEDAPLQLAGNERLSRWMLLSAAGIMVFLLLSLIIPQ